MRSHVALIRPGTRFPLFGRKRRINPTYFSFSFSSFSTTTIATTPTRLRLKGEVEDALRVGQPVVALESTIISHGMPYPRNKEVALQVEQVIRDLGCIPATIAIVDGEFCIGLDEEQMEIIANPESAVVKASRRDLAYVCTRRMHAATTVASTMMLAHLAGIRVFCTGGIGGVHRGAQESFDISADLQELARTPVAVVCAGIKSILDIPKSLEVLETLGVPVLGFKSESFPAFFTNDSGVRSPLVVDTEEQVARMMKVSSAELNSASGMVVAVPNPNPADTELIQKAVLEALERAETEGVTGASLTPFILSAVENLTGGKSLDANIALVLNNARVAANIARELSTANTAEPQSSIHGHHRHLHHQSIEKNARTRNDVVVVGGGVVDQVASSAQKFILHSSNPGNLSSNVGGVGRNLAVGIARLATSKSSGIGGAGNENVEVCLLSAFGKDEAGARVMRDLSESNVDVSRAKVVERATATYTAIHESGGDLVAAIADMDIFASIDASYIRSHETSIRHAKLAVSDGNIPREAFLELARICREAGVPLYFEPTSDHKCTLPLSVYLSDTINGMHCVDVIKPNLSELLVITKSLAMDSSFPLPPELEQERDVIVKLITTCLPDEGMDIRKVREVGRYLHQAMTPAPTHRCGQNAGKHVLITLGSRGCLWVGPTPYLHSQDGIIAHNFERHDDYTSSLFFPSHQNASASANIVNTSGAGDCFLSAIIQQVASEGCSTGTRAGVPTVRGIEHGLEVSRQSLLSPLSVPERFT